LLILLCTNQRLRERLWYTVTETLLALTIFKDEFDTAFVALFVSLLFVKVFHWLAADRVEYMEQTPQVSRWFHLRMVCVLSGLWLTDMLLIGFALESILIEGPSVMIMFASEVGPHLFLARAVLNIGLHST
jgi:E3 ubiquitin-protein ligase synoviolin